MVDREGWGYSRRAERKKKADRYPLLQWHVQAMDKGYWKYNNNDVTDNIEDRLRYRRLSTLWGFLDSFLGLEKLYLSFEELVGILPPCGHISRHRDTLRRLAQYDGAVANILIGDSDDSDEESQQDSEEESQRDSGGNAPSQNLPSNLYLECFGLSCGPEKVVRLFAPFQRPGCSQNFHGSLNGSIVSVLFRRSRSSTCALT